MSDFIPEHLRKNQILGGMPVPVVVAGGTKTRIELVPSTWPVGDLMTMSVPVSGPPDFGKYDEALNRECIAGRWCHVCGEPHPFLLICAPHGPQLRDFRGKPTPMLIQPWVCPPCLAFASRTCPPLRKVIEAGGGEVYSGLEKNQQAVAYWQPVYPEDPIPPEGKTVICSFKVVLRPNQRPTPLPKWVNTIGDNFWRKWRRR